MGRTLLNSNTSFDRDTVQLLCRAFDEAWQDIAGNYGNMAVEDRRTRLAAIILQLVSNGERNVADIKETALEILRLKERPATLNGSQLRE
jgi:hypothetical protein